ncbi:mannose-6-phosphate isomerase [Arthrobacter pigmenti]|uniref:Mannose-6-phosphate isomerase n=1 Tax=Arthrobacter pigmenti TaxID=271432 RepID=A0A846RZV6_9MICC|nr:class I mannose-6-phosphate isomerase [Arthrobacter pigmenti]NJC24476.1 mannose-6-phosphate isomerase [Arthrobacter pigmenti]
MEPILLPSNQPPSRFYQGGTRISEFRAETPSPPNTPEDWVASTTSVRGDSPVGMTRLADGRLLAEAISADPSAWLGPSHVDKYSEDTMLLVKLLDAGQRLPVHAHPDGEFASRHVSAAHGKAEAWYILSPGTVHLALTRSVSLDELQALVTTQDSAGMLGLMHEIPVEAGDCVFVPHGVLHSIGAGILLAEVQEPEDLSILLEWKGFDLDGQKDGHLGLGFDLALSAVEVQGRTDAEVEALVRRRVSDGGALPKEADAYFRLDRITHRREFPAGFSIVIVLGDDAQLTLASGAVHALAAGSTTLVPFEAGSFWIDGSALLARPPLP